MLQNKETLSDTQARQLGLNLLAKIVFTRLASNTSDAPSIRALAADLATDTRSTVRALDLLESAGLIQIERSGSGKQRNSYKIVDQPAAPADRPKRERLSPNQRLRRACVAKPKAAPQPTPAPAASNPSPILCLQLQFTLDGWQVEVSEEVPAEHTAQTATDLVGGN